MLVTNLLVLRHSMISMNLKHVLEILLVLETVFVSPIFLPVDFGHNLEVNAHSFPVTQVLGSTCSRQRFVCCTVGKLCIKKTHTFSLSFSCSLCWHFIWFIQYLIQSWCSYLNLIFKFLFFIGPQKISNICIKKAAGH